jgi:hypothetical protein
MLRSSQFTRSAAIAVTALSLAASPAVARLAVMPSPKVPATAAAQHTERFTEPRVDGMARRPLNAPVIAYPGSPVALTQAHDASGPSWLLIGVAAAAGLTLLLIVIVAGAKRHAAHPFRVRRV